MTDLDVLGAHRFWRMEADGKEQGSDHRTESRHQEKALEVDFAIRCEDFLKQVRAQSISHKHA